MALSPDKIIDLYKNGLKDGSITTMEPLLSLFMLDNKPMSLVGREPMLPLFKTERPKRTTLQAGRQVSKSMNNGAIAILGAGFAGMQVAIFEPRFTQKRAINTQILSPLLRNCLVSDRLIRPNNIDTMDVKKMLSGGNIFVVNAVLTGDQARGLSGIGLCIIDECLSRNECVCLYDGRTNKHISRKISQVKAGDVVASFSDNRVIYSVVVRDASHRGMRRCYSVQLASGRSVVCTSSHVFPTNIGNLRLSEIVESAYAGSAGCRSTKDTTYSEGLPIHFSQESALPRVRRIDTAMCAEHKMLKALGSLTSAQLGTVSLITQNRCSCSGLQEPTNSYQAAEKDIANILTPQPAEYAYDPIVSIEYVGYDDVYDIEVVGTHNYILANGICSYNCQDMLPSNLPVLEAVADAKVDTGFRIYSGTAKTLDGALALKFEQSSQGHWCVKCSCGKYNIFAPEEQLFTTIRDVGCCCAFCGKILNSATGGFIHKFPSRVFEHPGYHLPQTIFPFHHSPNAWKELIYKKNSLPKTQFYNEVLGVSDSDSVRLLTKADLLAARNEIRSVEQAKQLRQHFDLVVMGVDWGGGGGRESATAFSIIAKSFMNNRFETIYMKRLPTGLTPEQEVNLVDKVATEFRVDFIAHDYTGAGNIREALFVHAFPEWKSRLIAMTYSFKPNAELVTLSTSGSRTSHVIDKTRSLLLTMNCIKHGALSLPWFDPLDGAAPQLDFLAIIEHEHKLEETNGNEVLRKSEVYLLDKVAGVKDDAAQATNIGFIAACHTLGAYPVITYDSKFDITPDQEKLMLGD